MCLFLTQGNSIDADDVVFWAASEHAGWNAKGDHVDVVTREAIAVTLQLGRIGFTAQHRGHKPVESHDVKKEGIVGQAREKGYLSRRAGGDHEWVRRGRQC